MPQMRKSADKHISTVIVGIDHPVKGPARWAQGVCWGGSCHPGPSLHEDAWGGHTPQVTPALTHNAWRDSEGTCPPVDRKQRL